MFSLDSKSARFIHVVLLLAVCGVLFFSHLGAYPFYNKGEPREAIVVQDIVHHGNWLFPRRMGIGVPSKPPLFHWSGALTSIIRGRVTEVTTRFPSALFAAVGVFLMYGLGCKIYNPTVGFLGGVILGTSLEYARLAVAARVDMTLTFFVSLGLALFYLLYSNRLKGTLWTYLFYLVLGVSALAKGPVSLVITGLTIIVFLGMQKRWDYLSQLCIHPGVVLTLVIALFWYAMALMQGGEEFFDRQIIHENVARFFSYGETGTGHKKPIYYYFPYLFSGGLPWSLLFPFMIMELFRNKRYSDEGTLFLIVWVVVVFTFFSLSGGKRPPYIVPLFPPIALLTAAWFVRAVSVSIWEKTALRILAVILFCVAMVFVVSIVKSIWHGDPLWFLSRVTPLLKPKDLANLWIVKERMVRAGGLLVLFMLLSSFLWLTLSWCLWNLKIRSLPWSLAGISIVCGLLAQNIVLPALADARSYRPFMQEVNRVIETGQVYLYRSSVAANSLVFYRRGTVPIVEGTPLELAWRLRTSANYFIMEDRAWEAVRQRLGGDHAPLLRSKATGPGGKTRLILVRGIRG